MSEWRSNRPIVDVRAAGYERRLDFPARESAAAARCDRGASDATYARLVSRFGEQGVIDTIGISGYYTLLAMVLNTARVPVAAGNEFAPFARVFLLKQQEGGTPVSLVS